MFFSNNWPKVILSINSSSLLIGCQGQVLHVESGEDAGSRGGPSNSHCPSRTIFPKLIVVINKRNGCREAGESRNCAFANHRWIEADSSKGQFQSSISSNSIMPSFISAGFPGWTRYSLKLFHGKELNSFPPKGFFSESYNANEWKAKLKFDDPFLQDNHSYSMFGVIRGLHAQQGMGKLVSVVVGSIYGEFGVICWWANQQNKLTNRCGSGYSSGICDLWKMAWNCVGCPGEDFLLDSWWLRIKMVFNVINSISRIFARFSGE